MQRTAAVIGGGIVGLATAARLARDPGTRVVVLEKEGVLAAHQTGRNSGVIHSGIYYKPGSMKARTCIAGRKSLLAYCADRGIAHEVCGKVIVAVTESELPQLAMIAERGRANGVGVRELSGDELREREPAVTGVAALLVEDAGIVDYVGVCHALAEDIVRSGGEVRLNAPVTGIVPTTKSAASGDGDAGDGGASANAGAVVAGPWGELRVDTLINCAGLHCDRVAALAGATPSARIVPFRGEYYKLRAGAPELCRHLIYPVPDPSFPFLGVHLTRMVGGGVECGPNAVLALGREAYTWGAFNARDALEVAAFPGFWRMAAKHWRAGLGEVRRSLHLGSFVAALQRLVPGIRAEHLERAPAGIRAQAMDPSGALVDDFCIEVDGPCVHVLNAPSPAATASLAIADHIVGHVSGSAGAGTRGH